MKKIIILLICFYGVNAQAQSYIIDKIVAIVGSKPIKQSDVENGYLEYRRQGQPVRGDVKCDIFENLLTQKLLMNQAEVDSLVVEPSEVEMELNRKLDFLVSPEAQKEFENYWKKSIYEIKEDFRKSLYEMLMAKKMQDEIIQNVKITPSEVRSFFNRLHKDSIPYINGQMKVAQITMYPPYSDEAISEVRDKLLELRRQVVAGERPFRTLAVMYSECPSAKQGGELGFSSKAEWDPEFSKAAFALKNVNDVSRIVESKNGFHIIQLIGKRGDQVNVRHILITPKPNPEAITTTTTRLDSLAQFIRKGDVKWDVAARFSADEKTRNNGGLMINPHDQSTLFEWTHLEKVDYEVLKNMKIGEISEPFESRDDKQRIVYKIVKLIDRTDPHRATLKSDYSFLAEIALNEKRMKVIKEWVDEKIESSYIYIDESFKRCGLSNQNWLKQ